MQCRFVLALSAVLAACGDAGSNMDPGQPDAGATIECGAYPVPWVSASPSTEAAAAADLATLSPSAELKWDPASSTFHSIDRMNLALPACVDGANVYDQVRPLIAAHPTLFQIDLLDWRGPGPRDCGSVTETDNGLYTRIVRTRLAKHDTDWDSIQYAVRRVDGVVRLAGFLGAYTPLPQPALASALTACSRLTATQAEAIARATPLAAAVVQAAAAPREIMYLAMPDDDVAVSTEKWSSDPEAGDELKLVGRRTMTVTVSPKNYSADLLGSTARCPAADGTGFTVGFRLEVDAHTSAVVLVRPGIDCIIGSSP